VERGDHRNDQDQAGTREDWADSGQHGGLPCGACGRPRWSRGVAGSLPSAARLSGWSPGPRLCVPTSRWVCLYREGVSAYHCL